MNYDDCLSTITLIAEHKTSQRLCEIIRGPTLGKDDHSNTKVLDHTPRILGGANSSYKFQSDVDQCLMAMLRLWLKQSYHTEKYGRPSWEKLSVTVSHRCGGNDVVLYR